MISMTTEKAVAYALGTLQERGHLFVEPGTECYEGMIVGERSKAGDMVVNIARTKNLGNQRSSTSDISVQLVPPRTFSLEEALEYIADDELVEITPRTSACASVCSTPPTARRLPSAPVRSTNKRWGL